MVRSALRIRVFAAVGAGSVLGLTGVDVGRNGERGWQVFRSQVDVVSLNVSVTERNQPTVGLTRSDFEITDNGIPQTITDLRYDTVPIDLTLIVDVSGSGIDHAAITRGVSTVSQRLRPNDRLRIVAFGDQVREIRPLRAVASDVPADLGSGVRDALAPGSATVLYDALAYAVEVPTVVDRRQLTVLFTTGRDTGSRVNASSVLDRVQRSDVTISIVRTYLNLSPREPPPEGASAREVPGDPFAVPSSFFNQLVDVTGGRFQTIEPVTIVRNDSMRTQVRASIGADFLNAPFLRALDEFRVAYVLTYALQGVPRAGWHEISIRVRKPGKFQIRARKGYRV